MNWKAKLIKKLTIFLAKQYTSIGGQAVIEGVMMRSPNAFVVAVRKADGSIILRRDQWFGLGRRFDALKKPFIRGILILIETMANGIVSLNYSANVTMEDELKKEALKKGKSEEQFEAEKRKKEKVDWGTALTILASLAMGFGLFVFLPHGLTALMGKFFFDGELGLNSFLFHAIDGVIKAFIFLLYIFLIGLIPDIRRVFQYHGAEHMSISAFEAERPLEVVSTKGFSTLHPRCGTTFIFFLIFISIILFSVVFTFFKIGPDWGPLSVFGVTSIFGLEMVDAARHVLAIFYKFLLMFPIAGISFELIKLSGKYPNKLICKIISFPGLMLQKLTTRVPDDTQLEVALASIKSVLFLEEKYNLKEADKKILKKEEVTIKDLNEINPSTSTLVDFLE